MNGLEKLERWKLAKADSSLFIKIFSKAITPYDVQKYENYETYNELYKAKINKMDAGKTISDTKNVLIGNSKNLSLEKDPSLVKKSTSRKKGNYDMRR